MKKIKILTQKAELLSYFIYYDQNVQSWIAKKHGENKEYLTYIGSELKLLDYENPAISTLTELDNIKYKDFEKIKMSSKQYLKFEYEIKNLNGVVKKEDVYIFSENEWY